MKIEIYLTHQEIMNKTKELAKRISKEGEELNTITVLKGAKPFSEALRKELKALGTDVKNHEIRLSSYKGKKSSGKVVLGSEPVNITKKDFIIIEDIVDTGNTMAFLKTYLSEKGIKNVKICTLLNKPSKREKNIIPDYIAFTVPDKFLVGFGLDFEEQYRELPYIGILKDET